MADRVQQVGLALTGRRLEIERRELRLLERRHALRCVAGKDVGLAGDEGGKGQRRIEPDRGGEACIRERACGHRNHAGTIIGGTPTVIKPQVGQLPPPGVDHDVDLAHFAAGDLPCQLQPVMKPVTHPVGREFGREIEIERAALAIEAAKLDRLDPLAVQLMSQILAQPLTDIGPVSSKVHGFGIFHQIIIRRAARISRLVDPVHKLIPILLGPAGPCPAGVSVLLQQAKSGPLPEKHVSARAPCRPVCKNPGSPAPGETRIKNASALSASTEI